MGMNTATETAKPARKMQIKIGALYANKETGKVTTVIGSYTTQVRYTSDAGIAACTPEEFRAWFVRVCKA